MMIEQAIATLINELNESNLVLSSPLPDKPTLTIVYIEPKHIIQNGPTGQNRVRHMEPSVYLLLSGALANYSEALTFIERVAKFFHEHPVFTEAGFQVQQYASGIDQQCAIWTALQAAYRPSLMYKLDFTNRNI